MKKILTITPIFNFVNNGFCYLCALDDGTSWMRSVAGKWTQIKLSQSFDITTIQADFNAFQQAGLTYTENDIKVDNSSQTVVDPIKPAGVADANIKP